MSAESETQAQPAAVAAFFVQQGTHDMSQAIVNPADLRRFANNLKVFCSELQSQTTLLRAQMGSLGQTWRDQEHEKFMQEFEQTMQVVGRFLEASSQHVPFLLRKAERVEEYLQQR